MSLLALHNLDVEIAGRPILAGVSLTIARGEVYGLVGESGSGKSMTALAIMGLLPPEAKISGKITLEGRRLSDLPEGEMRRLRGHDISMIFQEPMTALNPMKTIGEQVAEALLVHGAASRSEALALARAKLDRVGLPEARFPLTLFPHELSGGQRQRVCIAMAIALRPKLLIADEPTTALDVTTQAQILALLKDLVREEGMSLLLITHDLAVIAGMAGQVGVMQAGRLVEEAPAAVVFRAPQHEYTRALIAASSHRPELLEVATDQPLLEVKHVSRSYALSRQGLWGARRRLEAVRDVSFTLHKGESLGLVGESGCGKSTLTRAILGLEALQGGEIRLAGHRVSGQMPNAVRAGLQTVFQDPYGSFNPRWTVGKLVAEPFHLLPKRPDDTADRVAQALTEVGLKPEDAGRYIHQFSGGQRQRIAIARALITKPDLIVLDEAVSALDVQVRAQILDLLVALRKSHGLSYLFISHDLQVVQAICDRVLVMKSGEIVEEGPSAQIFSAPRDPYTQRLVAAIPRLPKALAV